MVPRYNKDDWPNRFNADQKPANKGLPVFKSVPLVHANRLQLTGGVEVMLSLVCIVKNRKESAYETSTRWEANQIIKMRME